MKTLIALLLLSAASLLAVLPPLTSLTLIWDKAPSHGTNVGYVLKWGAQPGATNFSLSVGTNLMATVTNPTTGFLYFQVVAVASGVVESDPSNTIKETNYPGAPLQLRVKTNTTTGVRLEGSVDGVIWLHLANITNDPAQLAMRRSMMLRASTNLPPSPTTQPPP